MILARPPVNAVMLLKSLIPSFHDPHTAWLVLAMASTLAGNLTITGSAANLIVVERATLTLKLSVRLRVSGGTFTRWELLPICSNAICLNAVGTC